MKAMIAFGFDGALVGLMVGFEMLGHVPPAPPRTDVSAKDENAAAKPAPGSETMLEPEPAPVIKMALLPRPQLVASRKEPPAGPSTGS
jgi:hypothetical protein